MAKQTKTKKQAGNMGMLTASLFMTLLGVAVIYFAVYSFTLLAVGCVCFYIAYLLYSLNVKQGGKTLKQAWNNE